MAVKNVAIKTKPDAIRHAQSDGGMGVYLKRIFALMFGAVAVTALASWLTIFTQLGDILVTAHGSLSAVYYILLFGGLGLSIWAQARAFSFKPSTGALLLFLYAVIMGIVISPLLLIIGKTNPMSIPMAFGIAAAMFACMAIFGYKTVKNLSFLGIFLFMGMIGLLLVGVASLIWPAIISSTFGTIVSIIGVLVFALFTAYDMQTLKNAYAMGGDETRKNQLAVLGALQLYISFIAMFQYLLDLLNRN